MSIPYKEIAEGLASFIGLVNQVRKTEGNDAAADEIRRMAGLLHMSGSDVAQLDPKLIRAGTDRLTQRLSGNDEQADDIVDQRFSKEEP